MPPHGEAGHYGEEVLPSVRESVEQHQKNLILQALNESNWVKAKAAELLNMKRTTLVEKIKKMKIEESFL